MAGSTTALSAGWTVKIGDTGLIYAIATYETRRGDCIEYDSTTSTCTKYRNADCISHITIEEECSDVAIMNSGASNVDNNVGYGGLTSNANRPFGCYHDVNGDNKYHLNTKVTATPCTVNYNCICKSFSASDTDPTYATNVAAMWTNGGNEGIRLRFSSRCFLKMLWYCAKWKFTKITYQIQS